MDTTARGHKSPFIFDRIIIKLAGNQDRRKILDKFKFRQIRLIASELLALECRKKYFGHDSVIFYQIFIKLAGNADNDKISDEFKLDFWLV